MTDRYEVKTVEAGGKTYKIREIRGVFSVLLPGAERIGGALPSLQAAEDAIQAHSTGATPAPVAPVSAPSFSQDRPAADAEGVALAARHTDDTDAPVLPPGYTIEGPNRGWYAALGPDGEQVGAKKRSFDDAVQVAIEAAAEDGDEEEEDG